MNYAVVYFVGILVFCALYWMLQGRKSYTGPLVEEGAAKTEDDESLRLAAANGGEGEGVRSGKGTATELGKENGGSV